MRNAVFILNFKVKKEALQYKSVYLFMMDENNIMRFVAGSKKLDWPLLDFGNHFDLGFDQPLGNYKSNIGRVCFPDFLSSICDANFQVAPQGMMNILAFLIIRDV